jgi:hypothetical protein
VCRWGRKGAGREDNIRIAERKSKSIRGRTNCLPSENLEIPKGTQCNNNRIIYKTHYVPNVAVME